MRSRKNILYKSRWIMKTFHSIKFVKLLVHREINIACLWFTKEWNYKLYLLQNFIWFSSPFSFFLTLSNKVEKCLCIRIVCSSVCPLSNSRKCSSNVLKFIYFIHTAIPWTVLNTVSIRLTVCLQKHTKFFQYISAYGKKVFKTHYKILHEM